MEIADSTIDLIEMGDPVLLSDEAWQELDLENLVSGLVKAGVVQHRALGAKHLLQASSCVGEVRSRWARVRVLPRFSKFHRDLKRLVAAHATRNIESLDGSSKSPLPAPVDPVRVFVKSVSAAIDEGLPFDHVWTVSSGSGLKGRLSGPKTMAAYSYKGIHHCAVCEVQERKYAADVVTPIAAASAIVRDVGDLDAMELDLLDCCEIVLGGWEAENRARVLERGRRVLEGYGDRPALKAAITAAMAILAGEDWVSLEIDTSSRLWQRFTRMERLWEVAIFVALKSHFTLTGLRFQAVLHPLAARGESLFEDGGPELDPDILIYAGGRPIAVIDAKYKLALRPIASDVYQITCYLNRLGGRFGVLVYLTAGPGWASRVGSISRESEVWAVGVPKDHPVDGLRLFANRLADWF